MSGNQEAVLQVETGQTADSPVCRIAISSHHGLGVSFTVDTTERCFSSVRVSSLKRNMLHSLLCRKEVETHTPRIRNRRATVETKRTWL